MLDKVGHGVAPRASRVAIIGGGPGGLMTAYQLQQRCSVPFAATIYEASSRLGGKILTKQFESAPVAYEAGAAELYDYSQIGEDPLRELIDKLGLTVKPMNGNAVVIDDQVLRDPRRCRPHIWRVGAAGIAEIRPESQAMDEPAGVLRGRLEGSE